MADDSIVWQAIVNGNAEAFEFVFSLYSNPLRVFVRRYLGSAQGADDVVQETFLQFWKRPNGFDPTRGTLKQYLYGIARKQAAHRRKDWGLMHAESVRGGWVRAADQMADLNEALLQLQPDERALLWLREIEGYSYAELAKILAVPVGTVKSRISSARAALRGIWQGDQKVKEPL